VPGILNKITTEGNLVFDDIQNVPSDPKKAMEQMNMQIAGGSPLYLNGAMKSHNTKNKYDVSRQSITYLYNDVNNYKEPEKKYFDFMFENNGAIDTRYLKLLLKGKMVQKFKKDFDIKQMAEKNRSYYIKFAKELLYLKSVKTQNKYVRRWKHNSTLTVKGNRRINIYEEITWGIDMYSKTQEIYDRLVNVLDTAIKDYKEMIYTMCDTHQPTIEEEWVK
jgi:hypothetical protein